MLRWSPACSAPGPKFDYKLQWFERLASYASEVFGTGAPVVLAGDFSARDAKQKRPARRKAKM
ncbi:MAG TPA: hypothetical protein VGC39_08420 [Candidatus Methylacidiphilales bacterium]